MGNIESPMLNWLHNTTLIIKATERNYVERLVADILEGDQRIKTPNVSTGQFGEVIPSPKEMLQVRVEEVIQNFARHGIELTRTDAGGKVEYLLPKEVIEEMGSIITYFRPKKGGKLHPNFRLIKGKDAKPRVVRFTKEGENLLRDLDNQEVRRFPLTDMLITPVTRVFRASVVLQLAFMVKNSFRDAKGAFIQSKTGQIIGVASVQGFWDLAAKTEIAQLSKRTGLNSVSSFLKAGGQESLEFAKERLAKLTGFEKSTILLLPFEAARVALKTVEELGRVTENMTRVNEFSRSLKQSARDDGATEAQIIEAWQTGKFREIFKDDASFRNALVKANLAGREVAVDFADLGTGYIMQWLVRTAPFFGPRTQGIRKANRTLFGPKETNKKMAWIKGISVITIPQLLIAAWNELNGGGGGQPAGRDRPDHDINNWVTFYKDGKPHFRYPVTWEHGTIFGVIPQRFFSGVIEGMEDDKSRRDFALGVWTALENIVGGPPLAPIFQVPGEWFTNYKVFTKRPIESFGLKRFPPGERAKYFTSEFLKELGSKYDVSPVKMDHAVRGFFTAFGSAALYGLDAMMDEDDGVVRPDKYIGDNNVNRIFFPNPLREQSRALSTFYESWREKMQIENRKNEYLNSVVNDPKAFIRFTKNYPTVNLQPKLNKRLARKFGISPAVTAFDVGRNASQLINELQDYMLAVRERPASFTTPDGKEIYKGMDAGQIRKAKSKEMLRAKQQIVDYAKRANIKMDEIDNTMREFNKKLRLEDFQRGKNKKARLDEKKNKD